jgi:hypothetical protein
VLTAAADPSYGPPLRRWYNGWAATTWTRDEAHEAVAQLPPALPETQASDDDFLFGRVFALAGDADRAARFFARASRSCSLRDDFYRTRAKLALADASRGAPDRACALYADVASHWGAAPGSVTAAAAIARGRGLGCSFRSDAENQRGETR